MRDHTYNGGGAGSVTVDGYGLDVYVSHDDYDLDLASIRDEDGNIIEWADLSPEIQSGIRREAQKMQSDIETEAD